MSSGKHGDGREGRLLNIVVGMSGASGVIYGIRALEVLAEDLGVMTHLVMTPTAKMNVEIETSWAVADVEALADEVHAHRDVAASIASGSFEADAMLIAPCSMKTLSAVVNSYADNLLTRAADVMLKERRRLVVMPRETPIHLGHAKLMYELAQLGAILVPPMPAFYNRPATVEDIVDHSVGKALDMLGVDNKLVVPWTGRAV